ncbi:hypothetical protein D8674_037911 [Pyrus ussuriensis x Pyrus communis]|uniref:Uncharacterized protein n=1 Tax=Pyrus ussuriensis x Pyrus communis TaxID=2448454 RepID=A0A5N5GDZ0_9ROSA|nr:hypothetical protein D8674_037911 [Pyrus ussuriensis x Pyrus communis]
MHLIDELAMSNLISNCRAVSRDNKTPSPAGSAAATSPPDLGMTGVPRVLRRLSSLVRLPLFMEKDPRQVMHLSHSIFNLTIWNLDYNCFKVPHWYKVSPLHGILDIVWLQQRSSTVHWPATLAHHGKLSHLTSRKSFFMNYWFTQWKSDHHKHYDNYDSLEIALAVGCPKELVDRQDEWEWLCGHFQDKKYLVRGSKFPEIDMFKEVYVWPGDELTEQPHSTMVEKGQTVLEEMASQFPPKTPIEERGLVAMLVVEEMAMANKVVVVYGGDGCDKVVIVRGGGTGSQGG